MYDPSSHALACMLCHRQHALACVSLPACPCTSDPAISQHALHAMPSSRAPSEESGHLVKTSAKVHELCNAADAARSPYLLQQLQIACSLQDGGGQAASVATQRVCSP